MTWLTNVRNFLNKHSGQILMSPKGLAIISLSMFALAYHPDFCTIANVDLWWIAISVGALSSARAIYLHNNCNSIRQKKPKKYFSKAYLKKLKERRHDLEKYGDALKNQNKFLENVTEQIALLNKDKCIELRRRKHKNANIEKKFGQSSFSKIGVFSTKPGSPSQRDIAILLALEQNVSDEEISKPSAREIKGKTSNLQQHSEKLRSAVESWISDSRANLKESQQQYDNDVDIEKFNLS